jgi:hypothetical protein
MHGIRLDDSVDYNTLSMVHAVPVFSDYEEAQNCADSKTPAGPSIITFYKNPDRGVVVLH